MKVYVLTIGMKYDYGSEVSGVFRTKKAAHAHRKSLGLNFSKRNIVGHWWSIASFNI